MYKKVLENITGIEIYPEISLIIFFCIFPSDTWMDIYIKQKLY